MLMIGECLRTIRESKSLSQGDFLNDILIVCAMRYKTQV
jgi:cytoskeletal protein RodZ